MKIVLDKSELDGLDTADMVCVVEYAIEQYYAREDSDDHVQWVFRVDGVTVEISN